MSHTPSEVVFASLLTPERKVSLRHMLDTQLQDKPLSAAALQSWQTQWQTLTVSPDSDDREAAHVDWLIAVFNATFCMHDTILVRGTAEPEYFPATSDAPARIEFAHGFFASALHEISHWCLAGTHRRTQPDFGYWYAPDGRSQAEQAAFERVEIKPQAIECLLTLACGRTFRVSQDNLFADFDTSGSTFTHDVYEQALNYLEYPARLPKDAKRLLWVLLSCC
ncbi:elongation factor P hydroxylase [Psychrobacter aestuarii]|uniref:Elongation factor P hydroxylase n=1 Tax=Psychrobacter aestuarii TaxID=556327 RepID=A0ABP3FI06_9GAMM|nr:elongation factor P hydroxylase [Psychrobacter aestuarii]